jgi:hypothetical protein
MEVSGQLHAPATLPQGKCPWYQLDRRLGGGRGGEEKNSQPPLGFEPQSYDHSALYLLNFKPKNRMEMN